MKYYYPIFNDKKIFNSSANKSQMNPPLTNKNH